MRIENGVVVGSNGKYDSKNPLARYLLSCFDRAVEACILEAAPKSVLEIGCGEGHVTDIILRTPVARVLATDISTSLVDENAARTSDPRVSFQAADMTQFSPRERFDAVVCCEVLEHLDDPDHGLDVLHGFGAREYVLSVPREPIWRVLNMCRGAYLGDLGNSPGHVNHFSQRAFLRFVEKRFHVRSLYAPLPWTVLRCQPR